LHRGVSGAVKGCTEASRAAAEAARSELGEDAHRHSQAMLQALQRQGSRARKRAQEVASSILAQSRSDRQRQLASGGSWSDSDLEGPLIALARQLRRPNATFELPLETLREWEDASATAMREGGAGGSGSAIATRLIHLASTVALPQNDQTRAEVLRAEDPTNGFIALLQRARLHRHLPKLLEVLDGWEAHKRSVWDAIELIETLRAQHVFPMSMLRLAEHEWDTIVSEATNAAGRQPHSFDADQ